MDLNYLFNQSLKNLGFKLKDQLPDAEFKEIKKILRELQKHIAWQINDKVFFHPDYEPTDIEVWESNALQSVRSFIHSTLDESANAEQK